MYYYFDVIFSRDKLKVDQIRYTSDKRSIINSSVYTFYKLVKLIAKIISLDKEVYNYELFHKIETQFCKIENRHYIMELVWVERHNIKLLRKYTSLLFSSFSKYFNFQFQFIFMNKLMHLNLFFSYSPIKHYTSVTFSIDGLSLLSLMTSNFDEFSQYLQFHRGDNSCAEENSL